jgi:hypothetical protein
MTKRPKIAAHPVEEYPDFKEFPVYQTRLPD